MAKVREESSFCELQILRDGASLFHLDLGCFVLLPAQRIKIVIRADSLRGKQAIAAGGNLLQIELPLAVERGGSDFGRFAVDRYENYQAGRGALFVRSGDRACQLAAACADHEYEVDRAVDRDDPIRRLLTFHLDFPQEAATLETFHHDAIAGGRDVAKSKGAGGGERGVEQTRRRHGIYRLKSQLCR